MRRRLARTRDTLDAGNLPRGLATDLGHRTRMTTPRQDRRHTLVTLGWQVLLAMLLVLPARWLAVWSIPALGAMFLPLLTWFLYDAVARFLWSQPVRQSLYVVGGAAVAGGVFWLLVRRPDARQAYVLVFGPAVLALAVASHVIAKQFAFWMTANIRVDRKTMWRWQGYWDDILRPAAPDDCPEIDSYRVGFLALPAAYAAGFLALAAVERGRFATYAGLVGLAVFALALLAAWALWSSTGLARRVGFGRAWRAAWQGVVTWYGYNRHQTVAAGVFQFPTVWFRRVAHRNVAAAVPLFLLVLATSHMLGGPFEAFLAGWREQTLAPGGLLEDEMSVLAPRAAGPLTPDNAGEVLTPNQRAWYARLSAGEREAYLRYLDERRYQLSAVRGAPQWLAVLLFGATAFLALVVLAPVGLFLLVFATTAGRLLVAYHDALEAPDAYEVRPDAWAWDNRVDRLLNSRNPVERDHLYLGQSLHGDYPVLLDVRLLQQHAHILGDTGSRKTSVGLAPLLTQLVARADASVLVVDLKGDKGFFECARVEAERAGLPFKFFTNIPGRSSHVYNPLAQSNASQLTVNQRSQALLQALALAYGEHYGEGYYGAINEVVLTTYLKHYRKIGSIRELFEYVRLSSAYHAIGGEREDWKNARHLTVLLERLAGVGPLNLSAGDLRDQPGAWEGRIDLPGLLGARQVVYFYLSSALEPTTVSPIARLAMYDLLAAAAPREGDCNRVYIFVDEFQRIITENVRLFLEQARSMRLHFILANQTMGQLRGAKLDLVDAVESCTAYKQVFRATDLTMLERLEKLSGEALYHELSWELGVPDGFNPRADAACDVADARERVARAQESIGPRLEKNSLIELSASPALSLVRFSEGSRYTQFGGYYTPIIHQFHVPEDVHQKRIERPWPAPDASTVCIAARPSGEAGGPPVATRAPADPTPIDPVAAVVDRLDQAPPPTPSRPRP